MANKYAGKWDKDLAENKWNACKATMVVAGKNKNENVQRGAPAPLLKKVTTIN
ncbi:MAG: hypothetical protein JRD05_08990 [Deltaproteobacteria bacterium]|nr:hypothetical protein [Deltaproteobacteria bacterium]